MENIIGRHRNLTILVAVLFAQLVGLAVQVKRTTDAGSARLIRLWVVSGITPIEKGMVGTTHWAGSVWRNYFYLRGVRSENRQLQSEITEMRLERARLEQDASQARRLQSLLGFKEQFISQTLAAQVISTTGSDFSRGIYIDKGSRDGVKPDMPVITPDGVVGKILRVYPHSSLVLEINDPSSGAGVILEKTRLQGILRGDSSHAGQTMLNNIMADEKVEPGETVLTSGGDRIYPKGLTVGTVADARPAGDGTFLHVRVKPSASLDRLEEVLVITKVEEKTPEIEAGSQVRAADILAERLPSVPKPAEGPAGAAGAVKPGTAASAAAGKPVVGSATATAVKPKPPAVSGSAAATAVNKPAPGTGTGAAAGQNFKAAEVPGAPAAGSKPSTAAGGVVAPNAVTVSKKPASVQLLNAAPAGSGAVVKKAVIPKPVVKPAVEEPKPVNPPAPEDPSSPPQGGEH